MQVDNEKIIAECKKFLQDSSKHYSASVSRRKRAIEMYSGSFWIDDLKKDWRRTKRPTEHFSNWGVLANAIASPYSNSPWHTEIEGKNDVLQEAIDKFESDNDVKSADMSAFKRMVIAGNGFGVVTTTEDAFTKKVIPTFEVISDVAAVALDPSISTLSGHDAEAGAIVNYVSIAKARREFGDDCVPMDYPESQPLLSDFGNQWETIPDGCIAVVNYFRKDKNGFVECHKICGDKVVKSELMPTTIIPIVRFAGYEIMSEGKTDYIGIVDKTYSLQLGINLGYSTLLERMNRAPKANFIYKDTSIGGLEEYVSKAADDDGLVLLYKGDTPPQVIQESYQTADLIATIETTRTLMADVVGVPLTGIQGIQQNTRTATEVLQQQVNAESNVANFYHAAYEANRHIARVVIQMLNGGTDVTFKLENGPDVITRQMKRRTELATIATLVPDEMKPLLAMHYAETLDSEFANKVAADIVANMDVSLKVVSDKDVDPNAVHTINQFKALTEKMQQKIEELVADNDEKQKQIESLNLTMMNEREARQQNWAEFQISESNKVALETAKIQQQGNVDAAKIELQNRKQQAEAAEAMGKLQLENDKTIAKVMTDEV